MSRARGERAAAWWSSWAALALGAVGGGCSAAGGAGGAGGGGPACSIDADCPPPQNECQLATCDDDVCRLTPKPATASCAMGQGTCDGNGQCNLCEPGLTLCDGATLFVCAANGTFDDPITCEGDTPYCDPSKPKCVACYEASQCVEQNPCKVPNCAQNLCLGGPVPDGTACVSEGDAGTCVAGECKVCLSGAKKCGGPGGTQPLLCVGGVWTQGAACPNGQSCADGACVPVGGPPCNSGPNDDADGDTFKPSEGDCNDCTAAINPGAVESTLTVFDDDCDGTFDNTPQPCDANLALGDLDPKNGARAIDLCRFLSAGQPGWGVVDAKYTRADGTPMGPTYSIGLVTQFGTDPSNLPRKGARMLGLSSGFARDQDDPNACGSQSCLHSNMDSLSSPDASDHPNPGSATFAAGYPQSNPACMSARGLNDDVGLRLKLRAPGTASGFSYFTRFFTNENTAMCSPYNDQVVTWSSLSVAGALGGNLSLAADGGPIGVNGGGWDPLKPLMGTGLGGETTTWLRTSAPLLGGAYFELFFLIYDVSDSAFDSTVLIDGFEWITDGSVVTLSTTPVP